MMTCSCEKTGTKCASRLFQVQHLPCIILTVKVLCGRNISNGWFQDRLDTPDPYVKLRVKTAPEGRQRTRTIDDSINPVWNETFTFFLAFSEENVLELTLMEANPFNLDQQVDTVTFRVHDRIEEFGKWQTEVFTFTGGSEIDVAFHMEWDQNPTLRYSLCLSDPEKEFMRKRKNKVWQALNELLGEQGPRTVDEAPTIAVIGSGGGFRAMTGYSGVFKALHTTGLLDCATYACGLSGSSWYLSTLYSHPRWPEMNPRDMQSELMNNIDKSLMRLLSPQSIIRYINSVITKRRQGQPVSFTDFFGHMVGETLLKGRLDSKLTDQREKIKDGDVPMPLYTCVHVKKDVPARSFQEWVEFSPYEIGLPKYGTFMDSELFGSKFFMGKLARKYQEPPLHFLQGIWGSAFCILFKRLMEDNRNMDPAEMIRREMGQQLQEQNDNDDDSSDLSDDDSDEDDEESDDEVITEALAKRRDSNELVKKRRGSKDVEKRRKGSLVPPSFIKRGSNDSQADSCDSSDRDTSDSESHVIDLRPPESFLKRQDSSEGFDDVDTPSCSFRRSASPNTPTPMEGAPRPIRRTSNLSGSENNGLSSSPDCPKKGVRFSQLVDQYEQRKAKQLTKKTVSGKPVLKRASSSRRGKSKSYWSSVMKGIFEYQKFELLTTRSGRAAVIHNFMRGLSLQQTYPLSPFTPLQERVQEGDEFDGIFDMHPTHIKHIYMVDAGLTFNSPYPLILRPQRGVDVILSFDFSGRPSDSTPPFKELLLAEKWARLNRLPFPPIDPTIVERDGLKELYVFQNPDDPHCPVVLHFALVNINFREFKAPGVRRETQEEKDFADFDIFDDPARPYSTFNFTYTHEQFLRLSQLTEFNTLLSMPRVKQVLAEVVARKRKAAPRGAVQPGEIKLLRMKSVQEKRQLKKFLKRMESMGKIVPPTPTPSGTAPPTPFFTPTPLEHKLERNPFVFRYKSSSSSSGSSQPDQSVQGDLKQFFKTSRQDSQLDATRSPSTYDGTSSPRENLNPFFRNTSREGSQIRTTSADVPNRTTSHVKYSDNGLLQASKQDSHSKAPFSGVSSHQNGEVNPFLLARQDSDTKPRHDGRRNSKTAVRRREPVGFNKQHPNFVTASSSSPPPSPSPSPEHSNHNHSNPQQQTSPHPDTVRQSSDTTDGLTRHASRVSEASSVSDDEFFDAPESFKRDGTPVTDHHEAKMHFEGAKERRKLLRRQSTISSLSSSITNSVSLDSAEDDHHARASLSSSTGAANIDVNDLDQFEGIDLDHNHAGNNAQDEEEDPFFNTSHRGSVVTIVKQGGS
ncbi:cytosolic phospholipase A2-like [Littorina saxatilis]|uniref:Phospholipase A2 n=1 Tax=Littorina saxatilis TaxID=31220 RepID=A0AAN9G0N6_9CAEN